MNRFFRKIICPRDGDPTNISHYANNFLANMRDGAPAFSVIDYIWEEIKGISLNPQKNCSFAPYLMFIIEDVTNRSFPKDGFHMPLRTTPTKKPLIPPAQASSPPRADPTPQQQHEIAESVRPVWVTRGNLQLNREKNPPPQSKSCLDFYLAYVALTMPLRQGFMRREKAHKNLQKDMKEVKKALYPNKTPSLPGSEERESNCDRTTSKMRGFVSQDHIGGFSTKRECANTHK
jgi:hypothetical protein